MFDTQISFNVRDFINQIKQDTQLGDKFGAKQFTNLYKYGEAIEQHHPDLKISKWFIKSPIHSKFMQLANQVSLTPGNSISKTNPNVLYAYSTAKPNKFRRAKKVDILTVLGKLRITVQDYYDKHLILNKLFIKDFAQLIHAVHLAKGQRSLDDVTAEIQPLVEFLDDDGLNFLEKHHFKYGYLLGGKHPSVHAHCLYKVNGSRIQHLNHHDVDQLLVEFLKLVKKTTWVDNSQLSNQQYQQLTHLVNSKN